MKELGIDFSDWKQLVDLMDNADDYPCMLMGNTANGEFIMTSILEDKIIVEVVFDSGYSLKSVYHRDGTVEQICDNI